MVTLWAVHSCARLQRVASAARLSSMYLVERWARSASSALSSAGGTFSFFSLWPFACPVSLPLFCIRPHLRAFCSAFFEFPFLAAFWREVFCKRVASVEYRGVPAIWEEALRRASSCLSVLFLPFLGDGFWHSCFLARGSSWVCLGSVPLLVRVLLAFSSPTPFLAVSCNLRRRRRPEHTFGEPSRGGVGVRVLSSFSSLFLFPFLGLWGMVVVGEGSLVRAPVLESECRSWLRSLSGLCELLRLPG